MEEKYDVSKRFVIVDIADLVIPVIAKDIAESGGKSRVVLGGKLLSLEYCLVGIKGILSKQGVDRDVVVGNGGGGYCDYNVDDYVNLLEQGNL